MNNPSKKHHFLPQHYLKGFVDERGRYCVYDKKEDRFFSASPSNSFFENNLNTVPLPKGGSSDFLEDVYSHQEYISWEAFNRIRNSDHKASVSALDRMHLYLFLSFLYWRLPRNAELVKRFSQNALRDDVAGFDFFHLRGGDPNIRSATAKLLRESPAFQKSFRAMIPFAPFHKNKNWSEGLENWRFLYAQDSSNWYLVGDTPIILKDGGDANPNHFLDEFIFPLSGKILLVNLRRPLSSGQPGQTILQFNLSMIERAERFVAGANEQWLRTLVNLYKSEAERSVPQSQTAQIYKMLETETPH